MNRRYWVLLGLVMGWAMGCGQDDYDGALRGGRLERTRFDGKWQRQRFPYGGVSVELPVSTNWHFVRDSDRVFIGLHPVSPPLLVFDDAQLLTRIRFERMGRQRFEERRAITQGSLLYEEGDAELRAHLESEGAWHSEIERHEWKGTSFRYDIACPDESIVTMDVELVNLSRGGVALHEAEDEAAIRRILNSVECIDQVPLPK